MKLEPTSLLTRKLRRTMVNTLEITYLELLAVDGEGVRTAPARSVRQRESRINQPLPAEMVSVKRWKSSWA
jgi:hypothetical protein